jgi:hypothetical protein
LTGIDLILRIALWRPASHHSRVRIASGAAGHALPPVTVAGTKLSNGVGALAAELAAAAIDYQREPTSQKGQRRIA